MINEGNQAELCYLTRYHRHIVSKISDANDSEIEPHSGHHDNYTREHNDTHIISDSCVVSSLHRRRLINMFSSVYWYDFLADLRFHC